MRIAVISNSLAGRGRAAKLSALLRRSLAAHDARFYHTRSRLESMGAARASVADGCETIVAVGGDGTVNAVAGNLIGGGASLGIVPVGSANDLARECGLPTDPARAIEVALNGRERCIDAVFVNGVHFFTCGGIGLPSDVIADVTRDRRSLFSRLLKRCDGSLCYTQATVRRLISGRLAPVELDLCADGRQVRIRAHALVAANQPRFGKRFRIAPDADSGDGRLDFCVLTDEGCISVLARNIYHITRGSHLDRTGVTMFRAESAVVRAASPVAFFGDGELLLRDSEFRLSIYPSALRIKCPPSA